MHTIEDGNGAQLPALDHTREARENFEPSPHRILVGGFDEDAQRELADVFMAAGYDLTVVPDRAELLDLIQGAFLGRGPNGWFDLIILDARAPDPLLLQVLETIRLAGWELPVVLRCNPRNDAVAAAARAVGGQMAFDTSSLLQAAWHTLFLKEHPNKKLLKGSKGRRA